jgi:predicted DsbA family dithiol-disulfide isomerase
MTELSIDVVSDVVCPWCFLGAARLEQAIASVPEVNVSVRWRPYQLDPTIPAGGIDRQQYMRAKFGEGDRLTKAHERLVELGSAVGISFDFDAIKVAPNTLDAHRLVRWAAASGDGLQTPVVHELFSLYFERGANIGDRSVLTEAARRTGLDAAVIESLLAGDADREAVADEAAAASRMGITGVPCFLLEGKYAVMGAQETTVLADAIRQVAAAKERGELPTT